MNTPAKVLIVNKNPRVHNPLACHAGMGVTATNNRLYLNQKGVAADAFSVIDGYDLRNQLRSGNWNSVTHLIMSAPFFDCGFLKQLCGEFSNIQFTTTIHSNAGFLGLDPWAMGLLGELVQAEKTLSNFKLSVNSVKFAKVVNEIYKISCLTLPNLYPHIEPVSVRKPNHNSIIKIGCFSALRSLKNMPTAAFAAAVFAAQSKKTVEFSIMSGRNEDPQAEKILTGIQRLYTGLDNIKLVQYPWVPWTEFRELVRTMDMLFMPSFTESFNNVCADAIGVGVPVVGSTAIDWLPKQCQANPDNAVNIADIAHSIYHDPLIIRDSVKALQSHNDKSFAMWNQWIHPQPPAKCPVWKKIVGFIKKL